MQYSSNSHTFAICAYKQSQFLEDHISSLINQTVKSKIIMVTSTPNPYIQSLADQYQIELFVNHGESGITQDWNFALQCVKTPLATIAHQDDIYDETYTEHVLRAANNVSRPLIIFSDYAEIRDGEKVLKNHLLSVKRIMLKPLEIKSFHRSIFIRRRILSLGSPICCPSVTYNLEALDQPIFHNHFRSDEDWEAWEKISRLKGSFVYMKKILMCHRIHKDSETSAIIGDTGRSQEDFEMFCKFWPKWIAGIIEKFYSRSEKSNELENE